MHYHHLYGVVKRNTKVILLLVFSALLALVIIQIKGNRSAQAEHGDTITSGLVLQYKLNNNATDSSASVNNGIVTGATFSTDTPYAVAGNTHSGDLSGALDNVLSTSNVGISGASARTSPGSRRSGGQDSRALSNADRASERWSCLASAMAMTS